jgi:nitrite reductase/ring-hydroxylating ferredoxin subunit
MNGASEPGPNACESCGDSLNRRTFVERASLVAAAVLLGLGVPRRALALMRPGTIDAIARRATIITYPIPAADGVLIDRTNEVILARWHGTVIAFNLACPHQRAPLRWLASDARYECPKHHSRYTPDGAYISGRSTRAMDRLGITRVADTVHVDLDVVIKEPDQPGQWQAAQVVVG